MPFSFASLGSTKGTKFPIGAYRYTHTDGCLSHAGPALVNMALQARVVWAPVSRTANRFFILSFSVLFIIYLKEKVSKNLKDGSKFIICILQYKFLKIIFFFCHFKNSICAPLQQMALQTTAWFAYAQSRPWSHGSKVGNLRIWPRFLFIVLFFLLFSTNLLLTGSLNKF